MLLKSSIFICLFFISFLSLRIDILHLIVSFVVIPYFFTLIMDSFNSLNIFISPALKSLRLKSEISFLSVSITYIFS